MQIDTGFADVNGIRLYYEIAGSGHPLVFIHGFTLDTRMWDDQFEVFAQHYRVLRYDARGFGKSTLPTSEPYSPAEDLRALMKYLGIEHAHIIGLSMGGLIAVDFAVTYPESTDTLIPVDAALSGYQWQGERSSLTAGEKAKQGGIEAAKEWPRSSDRPLYAFITSAIGERPQYNLLKINILNFSGILPYALISH